MKDEREKKVQTQNLPDEELVKRCQQELPYITFSFEILVNRYKDNIFAKAMAMLRHRQDAEDVTQEIFLKVYDAIPRFRMDAAFKTWLTAIATNTCLTYIDRRKRKAWWWLTEDITEWGQSKKTDRNIFLLLSQQSDDHALRDMIQSVMEKLSPVSQEVLNLRFIEELDYQSIADTLNIKLSAAKMRLKRARAEFIETYQKLNEE